MKKIISIVMMAVMISANASAQDNDNEWSFNTRAWCTNYFTSLIYNVGAQLVKGLAFDGHSSDSLWCERILPDAEAVFPVGLAKEGFNETNNIYNPYHRAFGNPFQHIGDYCVGLDVSYKHKGIGAYAGAYFKSQEIIFKATDDNLRGYYLQPRAGLICGFDDYTIEAGVFYDALLGCGGSIPNTDKDMLKGGPGLDFAFGFHSKKDNTRTLLQFSMPLHNFLNTDYKGGDFTGMKRKVGYITLTQRILF